MEILVKNGEEKCIPHGRGYFATHHLISLICYSRHYYTTQAAHMNEWSSTFHNMHTGA